MIYNFIAYSPDDKRNLGRTYNQYMELLPTDDDWVCFIDHDALFTTPKWYHQIQHVIAKDINHEYGLYTTAASKVGHTQQMIKNCSCNHDMYYHRQLGKEQEEQYYGKVVDAKHPISGVVMITQKKIWKEVGGFLNKGFLGRDTSYHGLIIRAGYKVGIIGGLYVYHWYRGL